MYHGRNCRRACPGQTGSDGGYTFPGILLSASQRHKIEAEFATEDQRRNAAIQLWLVSDPYASWTGGGS